MKSLSLLILSLIATQAYANLLEGLEHAHGDHHGEHGDHGHGEHGDHHGEHGDHGHGEHGEHGEHGHADHGEHGEHGEHGDHAEGHHDHAEGDHQHDAQNTNNNDAFANALASDLGGGFLSSNPVSSNDFGAQPSNDLNQGFLQSNPGPTQAPVQAPRQNTAASSSNQGKQLIDDGGLGGPNYNTVPQTSFRCEDQATGGYFADTEADCQVFHICLNGDNLGSFLCPNGTLFHQQFFVCDWWFNVDCNVAPDSYNLNAAIGVVPEENL